MQEKNIFDDYSDISIKINESIKVKIFYIIFWINVFLKYLIWILLIKGK